MSGETRKPEFALEREVLKRGKGLLRQMDDQAVLFVDSNIASSMEAESHDPLFPGDKRIRASLAGDIYFISYRSTSRMNALFVDLPEGNDTKIEKVIWAKSTDVESGIRRSSHIAAKYEPGTGETILNIQEVIQRIHDLSQEYHRSGITEEERQKMAEETAEVLVRTGFANATKPEKVRIMDKVLAAGQRDVLQRINPPRSRMILSNVWIDLTKELIEGRYAKEKYKSIHAKLIRERELERFFLSQVHERINQIDEEREGSREIETEISDIQNFTHQYLNPNQIRVKPYSRAAAIVRFDLFGDGAAPAFDENGEVDRQKMNPHLTILSKYIGSDEAQIYKGTPHFKSLSIKDRISRLKGAAFTIEEALNEGEANLTQVAA